MPAGNPAAYNDPIVRQLIERGLLATGGNIRPIPFGSASEGVASGAAIDPNASSASSGVTRNTDGTYNVTDANGNEQTIDVSTAAEKLGEDPNSDLSWLAAMIAGATGAYLGSQIPRRKVDPLAPLDEPKQIGGTVGVEPDNRSSAIVPRNDDIVEGEFRVVEPKGVAERDEKALPQQQKRLVGPTAQELAKRRTAARGSATGEASRIVLPDEFSDLSPEELTKARQLTRELIRRRQRGNVAAYSPTRERTLSGKPRGRGGLPTSPNFATETEADLLGHVVRALRDAKTVRGLQRVVK